MKVKIKKLHPNAIIPTYAKPGDAGMDLTATSVEIKRNYIQFGTGLAFEIPEGYVGLLFPRSSLTKKSLILGNHVGVVDSGYRGEVSFRFKRMLNYQEVMENFKEIDDWVENYDEDSVPYMCINYSNDFQVMDSASEYQVGDRVGQIVILPYPQIEFQEVNELSNTERGDGKYGSTGK